MAATLASEKYNTIGTTFELKFICVCFFDNLSPVFIGNQNTCIATFTVPLATKKINPTGTKFELKLVFFLYCSFINN